MKTQYGNRIKISFSGTVGTGYSCLFVCLLTILQQQLSYIFNSGLELGGRGKNSKATLGESADKINLVFARCE